MYFLLNLSCLYVLSRKFISCITLTFRFNLTSHAKYIVLYWVSHLVIYYLRYHTHLVFHLPYHTCCWFESPMSHSLICCFLVQILAIGISPCHQTHVIPQIIYMVTRCGTSHRTIYLVWLVRLILKVSVIREMNLQESTYRWDEFTRKYTSFWLPRVTREMMGRKVWPLTLTNKLGVTS